MLRNTSDGVNKDNTIELYMETDSEFEMPASDFDKKKNNKTKTVACVCSLC